MIQNMLPMATQLKAYTAKLATYCCPVPVETIARSFMRLVRNDGSEPEEAFAIDQSLLMYADHDCAATSSPAASAPLLRGVPMHPARSAHTVRITTPSSSHPLMAWWCIMSRGNDESAVDS